MNRLTKVTNDPIVQSAGAVTVVGVGSNEDRRNGVATLIRCLYSSTPVIAGIWTSAIKQVVSMRRGEARKSAADEKASTLYPSDLMSLLMDSRKNWSSSTTETNDAIGIHAPAVRTSCDAGAPTTPSRAHANSLACAQE